MRFSNWLYPLLAVASLAGCGIDELFVSAGDPVVANPGAVLDGSTLETDSGASVDGGLGDAALEDASVDGGVDGGLDPSDPAYWAGCTLDDNTVAKISVPFSDESGHSLTAGTSGFAIAYRVDDGCDAVWATPVDAFGPIPPGLPALGADKCLAYRDLAIGRDVDSWLLAWIDNGTGSAELYAQHFDDQMTPLTGKLRITDNAFLESDPVLAVVGDTPLLAYLATDQDSGGVFVKHLDDTAAPRTLLPFSAGHSPHKLALAQMGLTHGAAAWVSTGNQPGVFLQPLTEAGEATGKQLRLTEFTNAGSTVDLATLKRGADNLRGGAAVYTTAPDGLNWQLRFRRLSEQGTPMDEERVLISAPARARDATIVSVGDGYAVAFRALPNGGSITEPQIRMFFATREGNVAEDAAGRTITYQVAQATATSGRITMRLSVEGQLLLSWLDFDPEAGQNVLKIARRQLNCQ